MNSHRTEDLAGQEDVHRESRSFMTAQHQRANDWRDYEVHESVPGLVATEVEPTRVEEQRQEMDCRARQQHDGQ
jgi:hypothetical protein